MMRVAMASLVGCALVCAQPVAAQGVRQDVAVSAISAAIGYVRNTMMPPTLQRHILVVDRVRSETAGLMPGRAVDLGENVARATGMQSGRLNDVLHCEANERGRQLCRISGADALIFVRLKTIDDTTGTVIVTFSEGNPATAVTLSMQRIGAQWHVKKVENVVFSDG